LQPGRTTSGSNCWNGHRCRHSPHFGTATTALRQPETRETRRHSLRPRILVAALRLILIAAKEFSGSSIVCLGFLSFCRDQCSPKQAPRASRRNFFDHYCPYSARAQGGERLAASPVRAMWAKGGNVLEQMGTADFV